MDDQFFPEIYSEIKKAQSIVRQVAHRTPLQYSNTFSKMTGAQIYLKLESLQRTGSFKIRGAYYALLKMSRERGLKECITASAGNHAQGVAYAASLVGMKATIVMPEYSSTAKILATQGYGGRVLLHGRTYDDAYKRAEELAEEKGIPFIHPFDDPNVIAGQGTVGLEMLEDQPELGTVVVPVGGGGLISGVGVAVKNIKPPLKVVGVQSSAAPSMATSLREGRVIEIPRSETIADGIAVKKPSELTLKIARGVVEEVVLVDDEEIARSMFLLLERAKQVVEPSGAAALAALLSGKIEGRGAVGVVVSGGNVDVSLLSRVIGRSLMTEGRLARIRGLLPDRPGTLKEVLATISGTRANVVNVEHDRIDPRIGPGKAEVVITLELISRSSLEEMVRALREAGYDFEVAHWTAPAGSKKA